MTALPVEIHWIQWKFAGFASRCARSVVNSFFGVLRSRAASHSSRFSAMAHRALALSDSDGDSPGVCLHARARERCVRIVSGVGVCELGWGGGLGEGNWIVRRRL